VASRWKTKALAPVDPRDAGKSQQKEPPKPIPIVLTFDDGPHAAAGKGVKNYTIGIATLLKSRNIVGAFFIQTHVSHRFGAAAGKDVIKKVSDLGTSLRFTPAATTTMRPIPSGSQPRRMTWTVTKSRTG
jgi:hypothetical protein